MLDDVKEACGVFGVHGHPDAAKLAYFGLYALQHRGQESAGIVSSDGNSIFSHRGMGLVVDVFRRPSNLEKLKGSLAIGHNRYSTTGSSHVQNAQPFVASLSTGMLAVGHNGNIVNHGAIRHQLKKEGAIFQTASDSEVILHLAARSGLPDIVSQVEYAVKHLKGAFSLVFMTKNQLMAVRDPKGFRPLCIGMLDGAYVVSSETCALDLISAEYVRDVEPGEFVLIDHNGIQSCDLFREKGPRAHCVFEYVYFSRPDSKIAGETVDKARRKLGKNLALEHPVDADIVISVPDSSNTAALGYASRSGIKFEIGLIRNHYVGRTFIHPSQSMRDSTVKIKFNTVEGVLKDRRIVLVDDSLVRGTTLKQLVKLIRKAGASEVHVRVSSPPIVSPCYYGMDFPTREELAANGLSREEIRKFIDADSLEYLSQEGLMNSVPEGGYCTACFTQQYPVPVDEEADKHQCELELS